MSQILLRQNVLILKMFILINNQLLSTANCFFSGATRRTELTTTLLTTKVLIGTSDRPTLERKFKPDIEHLLNKNRENISKLENVNGIKNLHTTEVQNFLNEKSMLLKLLIPTTTTGLTRCLPKLLHRITHQRSSV